MVCSQSACNNTATRKRQERGLVRRKLAPHASIVSVLGPAVSVELAAAESTKNPLLHAGTAPKGFRLPLDDIKNLIDAGKEKGYLTYNEVNNLIPHDVHSPESVDDLLATIGTHGN